MDLWAFLILAAGIGLYFYGKKSNDKVMHASYFVLGLGAGLLAGALWAASIVGRALGGF